MSWVKLDDRFTEHPKVLAAGEDAAWMFVAGLAYCNRNPVAAGFIPTNQVPRLTLKKNPMELAGRLVRCGEHLGKEGLWEEVPGGYVVHDYDKYQPTEEDETDEQKSARKKAAGQKGGLTTQRRSPGVAKNLRQFRSSTEAAPKQTTEADHRSSSYEPPKQRTEATPKQVPEAAPKQPSEAHRSPDPDPEKQLSHAREARDGATATQGWGGDDLDRLWVATYRRPLGDTTTAMALTRLIRETAAVRGEGPAAFAPRYLAAFAAMLAEWKGRDKHHGQPKAADAVEHFSVALGFLEGEQQPASSVGSELRTMAQIRAARAKARDEVA